MKRIWKYIALALLLAAAGYLVYRYRKELRSLLDGLLEKVSGVKERICCRCSERNDFADV